MLEEVVYRPAVLYIEKIEDTEVSYRSDLIFQLF